MVVAVVFGMIAAFLGFKLFSVLGKRTGHEQPLGKADDSFVAPKASENPDEHREPARGDSTRAVPSSDVEPLETDAVAGIRAISAADGRFSMIEFVEGAAAAYRFILEAYWRGDADALKPLVSEDVLEAFSDAIAKRTKKGEVLDNRLVAIERTTIADATLSGKTARITVRFDADIAAVTRNAKAAVIAGSLTDAVPTHDVWVFERELKSSNPNWILVDTDEAA